MPQATRLDIERWAAADLARMTPEEKQTLWRLQDKRSEAQRRAQFFADQAQNFAAAYDALLKAVTECNSDFVGSAGFDAFQKAQKAAEFFRERYLRYERDAQQLEEAFYYQIKALKEKER